MTNVAKEIEGIAGEWRSARASLGITDAYQLNVPVSLSGDCVITLGNAAGEEYEVKVDAANRRVIIDRGGRTGAYSAREFPLTNVIGNLNTDKNDIVLQFYVDQSSVELSTADGSLMMSTLVFPTTIYDRLTVKGQEVDAKVRDLSRVW